MTETTKGLWSLLATCLIWGSFPIYFNMLSDIPPLEILAQRTIWSFVFFMLMVVVQRRWNEILAILRSPKIWVVAAAALAISSNWLVYITAVSAGHVVEASLGYFIFPLSAVMMGVVVYREHLGVVKSAAVALAVGAVVFLAWGLHATPWISLILALTMCIYGMLKKGLPFAADVTVAVEVLILVPFALLYVAALHYGWGVPPGSGVFGTDWRTTVLVMCSGVLTGVPLVLFGYGAQRVPMGTLGVMFYINPTLQFAAAVMILNEPLTIYHMIAFPVIWLAITIFTTASLRRN